jgi:hypothetical protein
MTVTMPQASMFGVLPIFRGLEGKLTALRFIRAVSADEAKRKAELLARVLGGAIAFGVTYHPEFDVSEPLVVIARCGQVPEDWDADFEWAVVD